MLRFPEEGIYCVADGMGGVHGGEVASRAVVDGLRRDFEALARAAEPAGFARRVEEVRKSLNKTSDWIKSYGEERAAGGAGTTALVFVADPVNARRAAILHAGDSRAYRFRKDDLTALTKDHSVAAAAGVASESALPSMFRGVITRAVGLAREVVVEQTKVTVEPNDLFLLCSDGLTKLVPDEEIAKLIASNWSSGLDAISKGLVDAANAAGGDDNISVMLIRAAEDLPGSPDGPVVDDLPEPEVAPAPPEAPEKGEEKASEETGDSDRWTDTGNFEGEAPEQPSGPGVVLGRTPAPTGPSGPPSGRAATEGEVLTPISDVFPGRLTVAGDSPPDTKTEIPVGGPASRQVPASRVLVAAFGMAIAIFGLVVMCAKNPGGSASSKAPGSSEGGASRQGDAAEAVAVASLRVDVREALLTGGWGSLNSKAAEFQRDFPGVGEGLVEWRMLDAWTKEWKKVQAGPEVAKQLYAGLDESARAALTSVGLDVAGIEQPAWKGDTAAQADTYCSAAFALHRRVTESISSYVSKRAADIAQIETILLPQAARLQKEVSLDSSSTQEAFASLRTAVSDLKEWNDRNAVSKQPPSPALFGEAGAVLGGVERRMDEFYDRLAAAIRSWGGANMPALTSEAAKQRDLLALFSRICNGRDRHGTDVRAWRVEGGQDAVVSFLHLVGELSPDKRTQDSNG